MDNFRPESRGKTEREYRRNDEHDAARRRTAEKPFERGENAAEKRL
jgi:hypothetical protein